MKWVNSGIASLMVGERYVAVKTLWLKDKWGERKRCRIETVQMVDRKKRRKTPAWSKLAKDEKGIIGALVVGAHNAGWLKVSKFKKTAPYLFVSLDALPKRARKKLLMCIDCEILEEEGTILARERKSSNKYLASKKSKLFHEPGCPQAKRIKESNRVIFETKQKALEAGYKPHKMCGG